MYIRQLFMIENQENRRISTINFKANQELYFYITIFKGMLLSCVNYSPLCLYDYVIMKHFMNLSFISQLEERYMQYISQSRNWNRQKIATIQEQSPWANKVYVCFNAQWLAFTSL
jgi:hypothetical protein